MNYFALPKIKPFLSKTPLEFQHYISSLHHELTKGILPNEQSSDEIEDAILKMIDEHYSNYKIAEDFWKVAREADLEQLAEVLKTLHQLPRIKKRDVEVMRMRLLEGMTNKEIGEQLGVSSNRVYQVFYRTIHMIQICRGRQETNLSKDVSDLRESLKGGK